MRKIKAAKRFFEKHCYSVAIFAFIIIYSAFVSEGFKLWVPDSSIKAIHGVDYGVGFCSKLLPGAIYNLFFDKVDDVRTTIYIAIWMLGFFAVLSLVLEKFILNTKPENRKTALVLAAFFLTGPSTFAIHICYPGMLDTYWVFFALLFFLLLSKKQLTPLLFIPFVLCIMVYFSSLICFIPFFVIIILYKISCCDDKKEKVMLWSVLVFSVVTAVALSGYFIFFENDNLKYTIEEFHEIYAAKGIESFKYFDHSLYKSLNLQIGLEEQLNEALDSGDNKLKFFAELSYRIKHSLSKLYLKDKAVIFAAVFPVAAFGLSFLLSQLKTNLKSKKRLKAFSIMCLIILPFFSLITSVFFSEDMVRWIAHSFLTLFAGILYIIYKEKEQAWNWIENTLSKIPFTNIILYFIFYAAIFYEPY